MVLKSTWVDGEDVYAADMNAVAVQVNTNTADIAAGVSGFATQVHAATAKTTPADADEFGSADSAASFGPKRHTWANLKAAIKAYYDSVTSTLTNKTISGANNTLSAIGVGSLSATGTPSATTYLRGDNTWGTPAGGGGGYTPGGTDVAISDGGTGVSSLPSGLLIGAGTSAITAVTAPTGAVVGTTDAQTLTNKTLTTPTIGSFTNAAHTHANAAGGGQLSALTALNATGTPSSTTFLRGDNTWAAPGGGGSGDVAGPASATDNAITRFDTTSGKLIQSSPVTISDTGVISGATAIDTFTFQDNVTPTKQARFEVSGVTAGATRIVTLPDKDGTLAMLSDVGGGSTVIVPIQFHTPANVSATTGPTTTDEAYAARTLTSARMRVVTAPVGSALTVQVQHSSNAGGAWSSVGSPLSIAAGSTTEATVSFSQAQAIGDLVRLNVTSVGSTTPATGVVVDVLYSGPGGSVAGVAAGGTGAATLTANALLVGHGTSAVTGLSGTANGHVATWNGSAWVSAAPSGGGGGGGSMPNVIDDFGADPTGATSSGNAFRAAAAAGGAIRVPAGNYIFDGTPTNTDNLILHGDGPGQTTINISAGNLLWDRSTLFDCMEVAGIRFVGGLGAIRSTYASTTVSGYRVVENCRFEKFTGFGIGHRNTDSPYWTIRDCAFGARFATDDNLTALPAASAGTIGLALSGLVDTVNIENCDFYCYQIGVKLGLAGANAHIRGGNFLRYADYSTFPRVDIWIPPVPTYEDAGNGFDVTAVKFGNEGRDNADFCILYADATAGNFESALPVYTASTGYVTGHFIHHVLHSVNDTGLNPLVHSTTQNVLGGTYGPIAQSGASNPVPLLRYLNATGIDPTLVTSNIVGPRTDLLTDQYNPSDNLVTAVTGTIPYQPQNTLGTKVNTLRASGARTLVPAIKVNTFTGTTNTATLPALAGNKGVEFIFKNEGSGALTIQGGTNEVWNTAQASSYTIAAGGGGRIVNDGSHWVTF